MAKELGWKVAEPFAHPPARSSNPQSSSLKTGKQLKGNKVQLSGQMRKASNQLWTDFLQYPKSNFDFEIETDYAIQPKQNARRERDSLFHCNVHVFAERYLIKELRKLSLQKLHFSLIALHIKMIWTEVVQILVEVMACIYSQNVSTAAPKGSALRETVALYTACHMDFLREEPDFCDLLENTPKLGVDLFMVMS